MKTIDIAKASASLASFAKRLNGEPMLLTKNGKTLAEPLQVGGLDFAGIAPVAAAEERLGRDLFQKTMPTFRPSTRAACNVGVLIRICTRPWCG